MVSKQSEKNQSEERENASIIAIDSCLYASESGTDGRQIKPCLSSHLRRCEESENGAERIFKDFFRCGRRRSGRGTDFQTVDEENFSDCMFFPESGKNFRWRMRSGSSKRAR